jgi:dihydroorotate dehydrogenase electron transfer subunit
MTSVREAAHIAHQLALENGFMLLRASAPTLARHAQPGARVRLADSENDVAWHDVMRADGNAGWLELLYHRADPDFAYLAQQTRASSLRLELQSAPGVLPPLATPPQQALLIGGHERLAALIFLADVLRHGQSARRTLVLYESNGMSPFRAKPSQIVVPGMPWGTIAAIPLLEDWGLPSRLANRAGLPGHFEGGVLELALHWLEARAAAPQTMHIFVTDAQLAACTALRRYTNVEVQQLC